MNSYSSNWNTPSKAWLLQLVNFKHAIWTLEERYAIQFCFKLGKMPQKRMQCFRLLLEHHQLLSGIRDSRKPGSLWGTMRGVRGIRKSIHLSWLAKGLGKALLCWDFKGVQEEIRSEETSTLQLESVAILAGEFSQDNVRVHNSILVSDYLTKMGIKTVPPLPYSPDLAACNFRLFPKLRGCFYETIEEMKGAVTKVIDIPTQADFHGAFQKLLERYNKCITAGGDYFKGD